MEKFRLKHLNIETQIIKKLDTNSTLSHFAEIRTGIMGFEYWKMEPIIFNNFKDNSIRLFTNGNIDRYIDLWKDKEIKLYKKKYRKPTISLNKKFLNGNTIDLFKHHPKIIVRGVARKLSAIIDNSGSGLLVAVHSIVPRNISIKYVLCILNSNLLNWYHLNTIYSIRIPQGSLKYPISFFKNIPFVLTESRSLVTNIESLVDDIISSK